MVAGFACLATSPGLPVYLVGTALLGVGYPDGGPDPRHPRAVGLFKKRALPFGIYFTIGSLGGVAGPWMAVSGMGAAHGDWRPYWWARRSLVVVGGLCAALVGGRAWLEAGAERPTRPWPRTSRPPRPTPSLSHRHDWTVKEALARRSST
jgi:hypothetical protein